ncbi:MAG: hypothetical protein AAGB51_08965 [Planctomycetota bacterium]
MADPNKRLSGKLVAALLVGVIVLGSLIATVARWQGGNESLEPFRSDAADSETNPQETSSPGATRAAE